MPLGLLTCGFVALEYCCAGCAAPRSAGRPLAAKLTPRGRRSHCHDLPYLTLVTSALCGACFLLLHRKLGALERHPHRDASPQLSRLYLLPLVVLVPLLLATLALGTTTRRVDEVATQRPARAARRRCADACAQSDLSSEQLRKCNATAAQQSFSDDGGDEVAFSAERILELEFASFTSIWVLSVVGLLFLLRLYLGAISALLRAQAPRGPQHEAQGVGEHRF